MDDDYAKLLIRSLEQRAEIAEQRYNEVMELIKGMILANNAVMNPPIVSQEQLVENTVDEDTIREFLGGVNNVPAV